MTARASAHLLLASMFKEAVVDGVITSSPTARIKLPRRTSHQAAEMVLLTQADFATLLEKIPEHYRPLVVMLFGTGMRWGEHVGQVAKSPPRAPLHAVTLRAASDMAAC